MDEEADQHHGLGENGGGEQQGCGGHDVVSSVSFRSGTVRLMGAFVTAACFRCLPLR